MRISQISKWDKYYSKCLQIYLEYITIANNTIRFNNDKDILEIILFSSSLSYRNIEKGITITIINIVMIYTTYQNKIIFKSRAPMFVFALSNGINKI